MTEEIYNETESKMEKSLSHYQNEVSMVRTGRASTNILDSVKVIENELIGYSEDYYKANSGMNSAITEKIENIIHKKLYIKPLQLQQNFPQ